MQFESFSDFLAMGGYGLYVWLSFGVAGISLALLAGLSRWERKRLIQAIGQEQHPPGAYSGSTTTSAKSCAAQA